MNKPREIEELLDTHVWRRLGYVVVQAVRSTRVTPNALSVAGVVAAVACAWAYYHRSLAGALLGLLFMILHSVFDAADGQLARATGRGSPYGRVIDGIADNLSFTSIYLAVVLSYAHTGSPGVPAVVVVMILAAASHSIQCSLVEYQRQLFLYHSMGSRLAEEEQPEALRARRAQARGRERIILGLELGYAVQQRRLLPLSDRLQRATERVRIRLPELAEELAARYRAANLRLVRWWALMAPNSHKLAIIASAFVPLVFTAGPLHRLGMVTFLLYDIALNLPLVVLIAVQRRRDRRLLAALEDVADPAAADATRSPARAAG